MPNYLFELLLEEGKRLKAEEYMLLASLSMAPEMKPQGWKDLIRSLERASQDTDILEEEPHEVSIEKLKKIFGQK